MAADRALGLLLAWTSPGYPVGAFSYSHGLEAAVEDGSVGDAAGLVDYVAAVIARGGGWVDAVLFARAYEAWAGDGRSDEPRPRAEWRSATADGGAVIATAGRGDGARGKDPAGDDAGEAASSTDHDRAPDEAGQVAPSDIARNAALDAVAELAVAFRGSAETALESRQMGRSFLSVTRAAWPHPALDAFAARHGGRPVAHCIAGALACAAHGVPLRPALTAWLHGTAANLVSAGVRLVPLGQTDGQIATARLLPVIEDAAGRALVTGIDDLGTAAMLVELASLTHETQYTRLFRS